MPAYAEAAREAVIPAIALRGHAVDLFNADRDAGIGARVAEASMYVIWWYPALACLPPGAV